MKINYIKYFLTISLALYCSLNSFAQLNIDNKQINIIEFIGLQSDREIYCTNEEIFFNVTNLSHPDIKESNWSKVIYIEIITPNGKPIYQNKFEFENEKISGKIIIPKETLTGNYYIRAYTKWMRNFSPYTYFYKTIKIINYHSDELLQSTNELEHFTYTTFPNDSCKKSNIKIITNKNKYKTRELVSVSSYFSDKDIASSYFSVSVVKKESLFNYKLKPIQEIQSNIQSQYYIPETRGNTLSGRVINTADSLPISFAVVNLSIFNGTTISYSTLSNKNGFFYFALPKLEGTFEVFASVNYYKEEITPILLIDNDFCSKPISMPFIPFEYNEQDIRYLNELCLNSQIKDIFNQKPIVIKDTNNTKDPFFYGTPSFVLSLTDFIELPTLKDYFSELLPMVNVKTKQKQTYLKINGIYPELNIYQPLILVDFVAISNIDWVLSISPRKIRKIEIISSPYIRGNLVFGGIISIISIKGDFAGVNLPSSGQFFNYSMFTKNIINYPDSSIQNIPDIRNTLYWNPSLLLKQGEKSQFQFRTGDTNGEYYIVLKKYNKDKELEINYQPFKVE